MGFPFFLKKRKDKVRAVDIEEKLWQIGEGLDRLEKRLEKIGEGKISIERLNIERLENLTFRLEDLQIHELSGTLNIGNNLKTDSAVVEKIISPDDEEEAENEKKEGEKEEGRGGRIPGVAPSSPPLQRTARGYRYTPRAK